MKKLGKKELALAVKASSEELALEKAINAGKADGCIPGDTVADLSVTRFGDKKAPPFGSKKAAAKKLVRAAKRRTK